MAATTEPPRPRTAAPATGEWAATPARHVTPPLTLWIDRLMGYAIVAGGISVILAVMGIFVFIMYMVVPMLGGAEVRERTSHAVPKPAGDRYVVMGIDEWSELPFFVDNTGAITLLDVATGRGSFAAPIAFDPPRSVTAIRYRSSDSTLVYGAADGHVALVRMNYETSFEGDHRVVNVAPVVEPWVPVSAANAPIIDVAFAETDSGMMIAAIQGDDSNRQVHIVSFTRTTSLMGAGKPQLERDFDVTSLIRGTPTRTLVAGDGASVIVTTAEGTVFYLHREGDAFAVRQAFSPFEDQTDAAIATIEFVLGDVSLIVSHQSGLNRIYSLFVPPGESTRVYGLTKSFEPLPATPSICSAGERNKTFVLGGGNVMSLRYSTTESIRWQEELPYTVSLAALSAKMDFLAVLDDALNLHLLEVADPHPESSLRTYFGKVWYEGKPEPTWEWQSTGGTDDYEPKLSLVPLIFGTLKGTFYAMLFAVPVALSAAMYTSQFAHPRVRALVKPTMEIMASLPSVVLGFLAALFFAPLLETKVPAILCMLVLVPAAGLLAGAVFPRLPMRIRNTASYGWDVAILSLLLIGAVGASLWLGPHVERWLFVTNDPTTGAPIADFRYWWPQFFLGSDFQQRNSLVVGFMMGFAVIPIIFTIAEDSLSNVPGNLRSGSLALGASRWQTAVRIVLPTASAGIFSALMVGLGRAVGETMIVLMATGNTPIMEWSVFNGFRSLSANIAVELPEAPEGSTLYRTLFLGALILFIMTFVVNTLAEVLRQHLRRKYRSA